MSRYRAVLSLASLLALTSCDAQGAGRKARAPHPSESASVDKGAPAARDHFEPPGPDGWGRAGALRYLERTLGGGDPAQPLPLVIMIHGLGDVPRLDWFGGAGAIRTPLRLIMPQAPTPYYDGFAWFPYESANRDARVLAQGIAAAADELARSIALLRDHRPTVGRAIVAGFSQGGMLSYALALRHPALVELSHPISGLLPEPLWPADKPSGQRFPRILAMHGDRDQVVPIAPARRLIAHLKERGYDVALREFAGVAHAISEAMEAYTVETLDAAARALLRGAERGAGASR